MTIRGLSVTLLALVAPAVVVLPGCPSPPPPIVDAGIDAGPAVDAAAALAAMYADAGKGPAFFGDAGPSVPFASKEGRFSVLAPPGVAPSETTAGVTWTLGGASLGVGYYDGKPRGVDRSSAYDLARDKVGGSEIEKEQDATVSGFPTRMRRMRLVYMSRPVQFRRSAIIIAGDRTYQILCTSSSRADLDTPASNALFDSFKVEPAK